MFRIGDFSRISQVSITALRYYDEEGLLRPVHIDEWTGYRYYAAAQLPRLNRIIALKDLGFSLEEIKRMLEEDVPVEQLHGMLRLRRAEARMSVEAELARLNRVELRLRQLEMENKMPEYDVIVKKIEPLYVASARGIVRERQLSPVWGSVVAEGALVQEIGRVCDKLAGQVGALIKETGARGTGPWFLLYGQDGDDISLEMAAPVDAATARRALGEAGAEVGISEMPAVQEMATTVHKGPYENLLEAYSAIGRWIEDNGYRVTGPCREVYIHHDRKGTPPAHVTEIQFPVQKAQAGHLAANVTSN
jgi:DNA-binding transcriptional MerR regulator